MADCVNFIGNALIKSVEIQCGGAIIDKYTEDYSSIYEELSGNFPTKT